MFKTYTLCGSLDALLSFVHTKLDTFQWSRLTDISMEKESKCCVLSAYLITQVFNLPAIVKAFFIVLWIAESFKRQTWTFCGLSYFVFQIETSKGFKLGFCSSWKCVIYCQCYKTGISLANTVRLG